MLEEVEDPLVFQEAGHKVQVRFPILNAELSLGVALRALDLEVGIALLFEHLLHDLEHRQVLEDPAVSGK